MADGIWFRHDADASMDTRMVAMQARWDLQGIGAFWRFAEMLRANGGRIPKSDLEGVGYLMRWDHFTEFLSWSIGRGLFQEDESFIFSNRMIREIQDYEAFKAARQEAGRKGASTRWGSHSSPNAEAIAHGIAKNATDKTRQDRQDKQDRTDVKAGEPYGSHVRLTSESFKELTENIRGGEPEVRRLIETMNDYLSAGRKKPYRDYAAALRNWARKDGLLVPVGAGKVDYSTEI